MIKHIKYISLLASIVTLLASPAFANSGRVGVPVTAHTTLLIQNNTTGPLTINLGGVKVYNIDGDANWVPSQIETASLQVEVKQRLQGQRYQFTLPIEFADNSGNCILDVSYAPATQEVTATATNASTPYTCSAEVLTQGSHNMVMASFNAA